MNTPTPGPWHVSPLDGRTCGPSRFLVQSGTTIAQMQAVAIVVLRTSETKANARLIAAAPDLLETLREIVAMYDAHTRTLISPTVAAKLARAEAAIAKAEGA